jgi:hypothetical protein
VVHQVCGARALTRQNPPEREDRDRDRSLVESAFLFEITAKEKAVRKRTRERTNVKADVLAKEKIWWGT